MRCSLSFSFGSGRRYFGPSFNMESFFLFLLQHGVCRVFDGFMLDLVATVPGNGCR